MCGGSNDSEDTEESLEWEEHRLPHLLTEYEPKDIFNADETALFYKAISATTYAFQGEAVRGSETPKKLAYSPATCQHEWDREVMTHSYWHSEATHSFEKVSIHKCIVTLINFTHVLYCIYLCRCR